MEANESESHDDRSLAYPDESIGRLMSREYVAVRPEFTVAEALRHIRHHGRAYAAINDIYIVNGEGSLIGEIALSDLVLASLDQRIAELGGHRFASLEAGDDQELAIRQFQVHDAVTLPVVDDSGSLLGIVTVDDVMDVAEQESLEDLQKFGAMQHAITDPLTARPFHLYRERIGWLSVLLAMNVFSGFVISRFESLIASMVSLVFFLPLLIDSGGNAGAQSATLMIRSLAIGDVKLQDWLRLVGKEVLVASLLGITMAMGVAMIASIRAPEIVVVAASTMVLTVMISSLIGLLLPFLLTRCSFDPATASAPLVTSIADISGVVIYFSLASWFLAI